MNLYSLTVPHFEKSLQNVERWIDRAAELAKSKNFDPNDLLTARLAPDMLPLARQVMSICDQAKLVCARLTGKEAPVHPDTEKTWDELRTRMRSVREYIKGFSESDFDGADTRKVVLPWAGGKYLIGKDYVLEFALPNFGFHVTLIYALLRHNGVSLGKADFIGSVPLRDDA